MEPITRKKTGGSSKMILPRMIKINQSFPSMRLEDLKGEVTRALSSGLRQKIKPGMLVGITAGSRGISNIGLILSTTAAYIKSLGGNPLLISAMGSHGGGNAEGQKSLLRSLGIQEECIGAPVYCLTDADVIGRAFYGDVYLNRKSLECDAIIVVNRIKPHTSFHGSHESGLLKMLAVGLGGPAGAASLHSCQPHLLSKAVLEGAKVVLKVAPVALGLAILEDAYEQTMKVVPVQPENFIEKEKYLLQEAKACLPGLPVSELDVLIVDQIGKNFSGTGMDTNVIGRLRIQGNAEPEYPKIKRIAVLDVAPEAHGNAYGIGLADFTTELLVNKLNRDSIYLNAMTSTFIQRAMVPMTLSNDFDAIAAAIKSLGCFSLPGLKMIRIRNTLHLSEMLVSDSVYNEITGLPHIRVTGTFEEMKFNRNGNLQDF